MKQAVLISVIISLPLLLSAQSGNGSVLERLTLQECYQFIEQYYPLVNEKQIQDEMVALNRKIIRTANFPQLSVNGSATYQSEVAEFSPGSSMQGQGTSLTFPSVPQDQYSLSLDVNQMIYDGGRTGIRQKLSEVEGEVNKKSTEVDLYTVRQQMEQVYFMVVLSQKRLDNAAVLIANIRQKMSDFRTKVDNGVMLPSQLHVLEAELIKVRQDSTSIRANIGSGYRILTVLTGTEITPETRLVTPEVVTVQAEGQRMRPEYELFNNRKLMLDKQKRLTDTKKLPKLSAFGSAAYANPGLNFFDENFNGHFLVGLRLQWNFWDAFNNSDEKEVINYRKRSIDVREEAFSRQISSRLAEIEEQIQTIQKNLESDRKVIELREMIVSEKSNQLDNGTITSTEYLTELNKLDQARVTLMIRQLQLEQQRLNYATTLGVPGEEISLRNANK